MQRRLLVVAGMIGFALILGATVLREPIAWAAAQVVDAHVTNLDPNGNIMVHEQGTASVTGTVGLDPGANTVKLDASANAVRPVEQPFQQLIIVSTEDGLEQCGSIAPPSGMSLTIDSFSAEVFAARKPQAYIRSVRIDDGGSFLVVRGLALDLRPLPRDRWAGDVQTRLTTGHAPDPRGGTWLYTVCVSGEDADGFFFASIQAVVSGTLTPEQ
jgi:hypothetical protein